MTHPGTSRPSADSAAALAFDAGPAGRALAHGLRGLEMLAPQWAARLALRLFFTPLPTKLGLRRRPHRPWQAEALQAGGDRLSVLRHTPSAGRARPRVLLIHGWAGHALQMQMLGQTIAAAGFEPVLLNLPAHGHSAGWCCTMPQIVGSLLAVQARLGPFDAVVAHSMGGIGALHAVTRGLLARRLVVLAPSPSPAAVLSWFCDVFRLSAGLRARMGRHIEKELGMKLHEYETGWLAPRVQQPVLVIHDRGDRLSPLAHGEALAAALPQGRLVVTRGLSHRRLLSDPVVIDMVLDHLVAGLPG